jgi:hypothetical protein
MENQPRTYSAFANLVRLVHSGADLREAFERSRTAYADAAVNLVVLFDDATGEHTMVDREELPEAPHPWLAEKLAEKLAEPARAGESEGDAAKRAGPGRPKLGVVSREISLLPRHWAWLNEQPSGASAALRRLVDEARKTHARRDHARRTQNAAYKFLSVACGDLPDFEETARDLYEGRFDDASARVAGWPSDLVAHARRLFATAATARAELESEAAIAGLAVRA